MNFGAKLKIEEFDVEVEYESVTTPPPRQPPPGPRLVLEVPEEYAWGVDYHTNRPGVRILCWPKGDRR